MNLFNIINTLTTNNPNPEVHNTPNRVKAVIESNTSQEFKNYPNWHISQKNKPDVVLYNKKDKYYGTYLNDTIKINTVDRYNLLNKSHKTSGDVSRGLELHEKQLTNTFYHELGHHTQDYAPKSNIKYKISNDKLTSIYKKALHSGIIDNFAEQYDPSDLEEELGVRLFAEYGNYGWKNINKILKTKQEKQWFLNYIYRELPAASPIPE